MVSDDSHSATYAREKAAAAMTSAATTWLNSLDNDQSGLAAWASPLNPAAEKERLCWFYTPTDHGGLAIRDQSAHQQSLAMRLVASGLSIEGFATVAMVMGLENILDQLEGWGSTLGRQRGRDPGLYWLRIFGSPGDHVWAWRFGGHHISLNNVIIAGQVIATTPCFIGADPARTELLGGSLRPLEGVEDAAHDLVRTLSPDQFRQALLHTTAVSDIVSGNRPQVCHGDTMIHMQNLWRRPFPDPAMDEFVNDIDRQAEASSGYTEADHARVAITIPPNGISARDLNEEQRRLLRRLLSRYTGRAPEALAEAHDAHYAVDSVLDEVHFAWAGSIEEGKPHYYRAQGLDILLEYNHSQRNGNHTHSVWRDLRADFGLNQLANLRREHPEPPPSTTAKT
ncbi:DUF3500 domain-containing protein [Nonomuraea endophytica]|uniref:DUF3500 domain-containing protein n=1 Tax=Nonomuraea endophytica TaxID=714136 RepID=A0A7W8EHE9_9ACTN|nr:DUF3500 domain-containing protein [Nonomuraea endophytica]MBB5079509.1 hypothetical protein [Nonomuraea endophytica]